MKEKSNGGSSFSKKEKSNGGSLLTIAFQILVDSVLTANSLIKCTVDRIKAALACEGA